MTEAQFHHAVQHRIAQTAVGAAALRNQGARGIVKSCRDYFEQIDLGKFFEAMPNAADYQRFLDAQTNQLLAEFPVTVRTSWGVARKALNLFFRDVVYNKYFAEKYQLPDSLPENHVALANLEVPLDRDVALGIKRCYKRQLPPWYSIKSLTPDFSKELQQKANELAHQKGIARVHLDLVFWRSKKGNS
ncbi:MAG: hypothetical protein RIF36_00380 [Imperialibacter sp.]